MGNVCAVCPVEKPRSQRGNDIHPNKEIDPQRGGSIGIHLIPFGVDLDGQSINDRALGRGQKNHPPGDLPVPLFGNQVCNYINQVGPGAPDQRDDIGFAQKVDQMEGKYLPVMDGNKRDKMSPIRLAVMMHRTA